MADRIPDHFNRHRMKWLRHKSSFTDLPGSEIIHIMAADGSAFGEVYFRPDDKRRGYLASLSVAKSYRRGGLGTELQVLREKMIKRRGYKIALLWVLEKSWMRKWYERRGYKFHERHKRYKGCIWMKKIL